MNTIFILLMMIVVGALIGGITNSLAIKMLFRPYKAIYIGSWRVPFTPGLIPKRREELADQLGKMVVKHLLTAEGIGKKLSDHAFLQDITVWLQKELKEFLNSNVTISSFLEQYLQIKDIDKLLLEKTDNLLDLKLNNMLGKWESKKIDEAFPIEILNKIENSMPIVANFILEKGKGYFSSEEGKEQLSKMIDRFLMGKGTLGNMIGMFLGNERLVDKIQPEIIKFLNDEGTKVLLINILTKEWHNIKQRRMHEVIDFIGKENVISRLKEMIINQIPISKWIHKPLGSLIVSYEEKIVYHWLPTLVTILGQALTTRLGSLMQKLNLEDVVREQVDTFSVDRLEEMVLSISRREFKMITYLGALLGGGIGLIQGIFVLILN